MTYMENKRATELAISQKKSVRLGSLLASLAVLLILILN